MATGLFRWSRTPADNATSTYNWSEGMAPSAVNDSARGDKSDVAKWRDDISGAIVTGGSLSAYTVASFSGFDSLPNMSGQMIAFTPHATNGATVTLNVDGLGAKPLRAQPGLELPAGSLILGTPYVATYNNADAVWYLHNGAGIANAYSIPLGAGLDYWGATTPNSIFAFPAGQAISRTTYATLFALFGTTYGVGDGTTTFNLPDKSGRVSAMKESVATRLTNSGTGNVGIDGAALGAAGGGAQTLLTANLPAYTPIGTITNGAITPNGNQGVSPAGTVNRVVVGDSGPSTPLAGVLTISQAASTFVGTAQGGTSTPVKVAQPTIICNYILRVI